MRLTIESTQRIPTDIKLHQLSHILDLKFDNGEKFKLPCEFIRVYTPSAEALGHAAGQEILQIGKENINITAIKPIGNYAIQPTFTDGHDTGIYSWDMLYTLGSQYPALWENYLNELKKAGYTRKETLKN